MRVVIGHGHAPGIEHGASQVGTMGPTAPTYGRGSPSRSLHTHGLLHPNGKVQLVSFIKGRWRRT